MVAWLNRSRRQFLGKQREETLYLSPFDFVGGDASRKRSARAAIDCVPQFDQQSPTSDLGRRFQNTKSRWINDEELQTSLNAGREDFVDVAIAEAVADNHQLGLWLRKSGAKLSTVPVEQLNAVDLGALVLSHNEQT
jgi:hypothetical protein